MGDLLTLAGGFAMIAALLAGAALALYLVWWLVLLAVRFVPMIGRRHKHANWNELNRDGRNL